MDLLSTDDLMNILLAELNRKGIAGHHIDTMNEFYNVGLKQIITEGFSINIESVKPKIAKNDDEFVSYNVKFTDAYIKPTMATKFNTNELEIITPKLCRDKNLTYTSDLFLSLEFTATHSKKGTDKIKTVTETFSDVKIGQIPCMVGSTQCCTHNMTKEMLKNIGEDPLAPGGYFIVNGKEWVINNLENIKHNIAHIYKERHEKSLGSATILSKQGNNFDNSYQLIIRYLEDGQITVEISQLTTANSKSTNVPFYILFRVLGITSDKDIYDFIIHGIENDDRVSRDMKNLITKAFNVSYGKEFDDISKETDTWKNIGFLAQKTKRDTTTKVAQTAEYNRYQNQKFLNIIDLYILPHLGKTFEYRIKKAMYLAHMIHELLLVMLDIQEPNDRDSYSIKRIHSSGVSFAKAFKTLFNAYLIRDLNRKIRTAIENTRFDQINFKQLIKNSIENTDIISGMRKVITVGDDKLIIKNQEVSKHMTSQQVHYKNDMNVKSLLNNINARAPGTKQNERADHMRRVHHSYNGIIDVSQSADTGERVGTVKQMAISTSISPDMDDKELKEMIMNDKDVIQLSNIIFRDIKQKQLTKVFVNGDWIGCCKNAKQFVNRYIMKRRKDEIHFTTSIIWELTLQKINFWTDGGRLLRPLLIVYNNEEEYLKTKGKTKFKQYIKYTPEMSEKLQSKEITIDDLRKQQVLEYVACDEQVYISENIKKLIKHENDPTHVFTHCDIDQAILGIVTLASPFGNHSDAVRNTLYTAHRRQSCCWYALNYADRMDKDASVQHYCQKPLITTIVDEHISYPNGQVPMVAIQLYNGWGQEDSIIVNKNSVDIGMFSVSNYTYFESTLDKFEQWGVNPAITIGTENKNYSKLDGNFARQGEIIEKNDIIISKSAKLNKETGQFTHIDKSIRYNRNEIGYVDDRIIPEKDNDVLVAKIKVRSERYLDVGAKLSSRTGNKGIVSKLVRRDDMPYTKDGITPDLIINTHSIPTRMASNQLLEMFLGWLAILTGKQIDATIFRELDFDGVQKMMREYGFTSNGYHTMYDGKTGKEMKVEIFIGPNTYQRLQKFIQDEHYAIHRGPINRLTHQPLSGKANNGGLKIGEMENWCLSATGSMHFMNNKIYTDSDGNTLYVCRVCGRRAIVNEEKEIYECKICDTDADITKIKSSTMSNILLNELNAMNIRIDTFPAPYSFEVVESK